MRACMPSCRSTVIAGLILGLQSLARVALAADLAPADAATGEGGQARAPITEQSRGVDRVLTRAGQAIRYRATAGTLTLHSDDGDPIASMFYVAYTAVPPRGGAERPVTFFFNGGPGSASLWLNIGGFGPQRAVTATPRATPPAPYSFVANDASLLDRTDLVFLDAIGTGYSRALGPAGPERFWGVDSDVDAFARAILRYCELNQRWNSPKFLFGESYGTTRAAALAYRLHTRDVDLNGVILMSSILNFARLQPGTDQQYIDLLPSYAAAAWFHHRARDAGADEAAFLEDARVFASGAYATALAKGDRLPPDEEAAVAREAARFTGLPESYLRRAHLRVEMEDFRKELLREQGQVIGRFDSRFSGPNISPGGRFDPATDDPATAGVNGSYFAAFRDELARIGYGTALDYRPLFNAVIEPRWDMHHKAPGIDEPLTTPNTGFDLAATMGANPYLRVFSINGLYDLSTPFHGTEFDLAHLMLPPGLQGNISVKYYASGHQLYADGDALHELKRDLDAFYDEAAHRSRD